LEYHKCTVHKALPKGPKTDDMVKRQNWLTRVNAEDDLRLHRKRLVALVDRRNKDELTESAFIYKPPENARQIPSDPAPEWFVASSMKTILPDINYGDPSASPSADKTKHQNIGSSFDCGGGLLTLSIHAAESDRIKAYLCWNGKMMRFMPEDVRNILPVIFNMEHKGNKEFIVKDQCESYIKMMDTLLMDSEFDRFRADF